MRRISYNSSGIWAKITGCRGHIFIYTWILRLLAIIAADPDNGKTLVLFRFSHVFIAEHIINGFVNTYTLGSSLTMGKVKMNF